MLVEGGLYDQPVEWYAVQTAGYLWSFVERVSNGDTFKTSTLDGGRADGPEHKMYDQIIDIRKRG